jgi:hypothetical protein
MSSGIIAKLFGTRTMYNDPSIEDNLLGTDVLKPYALFQMNS